MKIYEAAAIIAQRHQLANDRLNDAIKALLPIDVGTPIETLSVPGITVSVPDPKTLFAMKVRGFPSRQRSRGHTAVVQAQRLHLSRGCPQILKRCICRKSART